MPNLACFAQSYLNLGMEVFSTDINMACSGFAGGLKLIEGLRYLKKPSGSIGISLRPICHHRL